MAGLQRSAQTFRRSGSSGLVWDERFLTDGADDSGGGGAAGARGSGPRRQPELRHSRSVGSVSMLPRRGEAEAAEHGDKKRTKLVVAAAKPKHNKDQQKQQQEVVVPGRKQGFRTRDVAPAAEPPSPRLPAGCCAPCAIFRGGSDGASLLARRAKAKPKKR